MHIIGKLFSKAFTWYFFKHYFMNPAMRQNFANAFAETHNLNLEVCHKSLGLLLRGVLKMSLIVSGVRGTKGQGHLLSCSGQLKMNRIRFLTTSEDV